MSTLQQDPKHHFFIVSDEQTGSFLFRKIIRTVQFSADDFEEFSNHFQRMSDELAVWVQKYGRKAHLLHIEIEAHPWILKRVKDRISQRFPEGHPYGDFSRKQTITLHLYDHLDPIGQCYTLYKEGKSFINQIETATQASSD
ncbi:hypothetical protein [Aquirhabdus sp.]|uniref:hypothetical protein n=1 Tax=Aquirhabdus sp. TaxID=2824160 RepID=UPI00396CA693